MAQMIGGKTGQSSGSSVGFFYITTNKIFFPGASSENSP